MTKISKVFVVLILIIIMSCGSAFASFADVDFTFQSKEPMNTSDKLFVSIDGKPFCSLTDTAVRVFSVKSATNIEHKPYDIIIEYTKDGQLKTYRFKGTKTYDIVLNFNFDGENVTQVK